MLSLSNKLGTLSALSFVLLITYQVIMQRSVVHKMIIKNFGILLFPLFCIVSSVWSDSPGRTFYFATQYFLTIFVSALITYSVPYRSIIFGCFLGFGAYAILAILFGNTVNVGADGDIAFVGLAGSKNQAGETAFVSLLWILGSVIAVKDRWRIPAWIFGFISAVACLFLLLNARATSALIFTAIGVPLFILLILVSKVPMVIRGLIVVLTIVLSSIIAVTSPFWASEAFRLALESAGKDVTLTGRVVLWDAAAELISQRPVLGNGFAGFWRIENPDAQYLWNAMAVSQGAPFNFHNTFLDLLVNVGSVGLVLYCSCVIVCIYLILKSFIMTPNIFVVISLTLLLCTLPKASFEVLGLAPFNLLTVTLFLALSYGANIAVKEPRGLVPKAAKLQDQEHLNST